MTMQCHDGINDGTPQFDIQIPSFCLSRGTHMAINELSPKQIENAKPQNTDYKLTDGGSLYLLVKKLVVNIGV